jgi:SAM-dependent methyltransferase
MGKESDLFEKFIKLPKEHKTEVASVSDVKWDFNNYGFWVGGHFNVKNLSGGYHGILKQWWEHYCETDKSNDVLLVSEGNDVKKTFESTYPNWNIKTTDKYYDLQSEPDIIADICEPNDFPENQFDLIINQATFEHLYDPWTAIRNCERALKTGGVFVIHTHPPGFGYHSYPRDYFRFMKDWWYDIPVYIDSLQLAEFFMKDNNHVFAAYIKK